MKTLAEMVSRFCELAAKPLPTSDAGLPEYLAGNREMELLLRDMEQQAKRDRAMDAQVDGRMKRLPQNICPQCKGKKPANTVRCIACEESD